MKSVILTIGALGIIGVGFLLTVKPHLVAEKLRSFYKKYPLVRYAGDRQLTSRPSYITALGIVIGLIGLFCLFSIHY